MKLETKLILFLSIAILCASCDVISANKVENISQISESAISKTEFSFAEKDFLTLKKEICPDDKDKSDATEPSGVVAIDKEGKNLLVIDDKSEKKCPNNLRIYDSLNGSLINELIIEGAHHKPKWEALARDKDENFYVIASHAGKNNEQIKERSSVFRFRLEKDEKGIYKIKSKIKLDISKSLETKKIDGNLIYDQEPSVTPDPSASPKLKEIQKAKIEGLAVKNIDGKKNLIIGLREPDSLVRVYSAEIPAELTDDVKLTLQPYFSFNAGKTADGEQSKLSSLEYVDEMKGFIVLTSSETTVPVPNTDGLPVFHGNGIWFISDEKIEKAQTVDGFRAIETIKISEFQKDNKAEGICFLPNSELNKFKFAIVYDNDTKDMRDAKANPLPVGKMQIVELTNNP